MAVRNTAGVAVGGLNVLGLLARNLALNSKSLKCSVGRGVLFLSCETSQWNPHDKKQRDKTIVETGCQNTRKSQRRPWWTRPWWTRHEIWGPIHHHILLILSCTYTKTSYFTVLKLNSYKINFLCVCVCGCMCVWVWVEGGGGGGDGRRVKQSKQRLTTLRLTRFVYFFYNICFVVFLVSSHGSVLRKLVLLTKHVGLEPGEFVFIYYVTDPGVEKFIGNFHWKRNDEFDMVRAQYVHQ